MNDLVQNKNLSRKIVPCGNKYFNSDEVNNLIDNNSSTGYCDLCNILFTINLKLPGRN